MLLKINQKMDIYLTVKVWFKLYTIEFIHMVYKTCNVNKIEECIIKTLLIYTPQIYYTPLQRLATNPTVVLGFSVTGWTYMKVLLKLKKTVLKNNQYQMSK